jgi:hypothetical protein
MRGTPKTRNASIANKNQARIGLAFFIHASAALNSSLATLQYGLPPLAQIMRGLNQDSSI